MACPHRALRRENVAQPQNQRGQSDAGPGTKFWCRLRRTLALCKSNLFDFCAETVRHIAAQHMAFNDKPFGGASTEEENKRLSLAR